MKKICKKICIYFLSLFLVFSNVSVPTYASAAVLGPILKTIGYSALGTGASYIVNKLLDSWLGTGKKYYDSTGSSNNMNYCNNNFSNVTNSGAKYENCYNSYSSTTTSYDNRTYSLVKNVNNTLSVYSPITNSYTTYNSVSYNNNYNTYNFVTNEYNYYITNNYTYVSYYITNNYTNEDSYYEIYYEMPDGRNSYTLEKEDIWGEYLIYDIVTYDKVAEDDGKTLALYHFNGDTKDYSYWNNDNFPLASGSFSSGK